MRNWPGQKHHPGIFEEFFPLILERLIEPGSVLTLFVYDWGTEGYFDPTQHVETQLKPRGLPYIYLPSNDVAQPGCLVAPEIFGFRMAAGIPQLHSRGALALQRTFCAN